MLNGVRVLVVEDEPLVALDVESTFRAAGADVTCATSIAHAMSLVETETVDFCVLDTQLWRGELSDGVADALVARDIPFVIFSAYRRGRAEAVACVQKPTTPDAVLQVAVTFLNQRRSNTKNPGLPLKD